MVLPTHDPGPAGGIPNSRTDTGIAASGGLRRERGDRFMNGKGVRIRFPQRPLLFHFPINPRNITVDLPTRLEVSQTLASPYVDALGKGLGSGQFSGTCGWGLPIDDPLSGKTGLERVLDLKRAYEEWQNETVLRIEPRLAACDLFFDFDLQMYQVVWNSLRIEHADGGPFLLNYTLSFTILHDYNSPVVILPLSQLDQAGGPANDGGSPIVQPAGGGNS